MEGEDPRERPDFITSIINGLERYNPEAVGTLEDYLRQQCEERFIDCNANRTLLKLYQLNPDRIKDEVITNVLVKSMTCFPSPQFSLCLHIIPPSLVNPHVSASAADGSSDGAAAAAAAPAVPVGELPEALGKLRALNDQLQGAQYDRFWATLDSDDLYADLTADVSGFEEMIRVRIATLVGHAYREVDLPLLESWLGLEGQAAAKFITETAGWAIDGAVVKVPRNPENEARKAEVREDVNVDMFSRVIRRAWEETA